MSNENNKIDKSNQSWADHAITYKYRDMIMSLWLKVF